MLLWLEGDGWGTITYGTGGLSEIAVLDWKRKAGAPYLGCTGGLC